MIYEKQIYILGDGNISKALQNLLKKEKILYIRLNSMSDILLISNAIIFLAIPDQAVLEALDLFEEIPVNTRVVHFAGGVLNHKNRVFLLHPYASINPKTNLVRSY